MEWKFNLSGSEQILESICRQKVRPEDCVVRSGSEVSKKGDKRRGAKHRLVFEDLVSEQAKGIN